MSTVDASEASILPSLLTSPSFMVITDADGVSSGVVAVSLLLDAVAAAPVSSAVTVGIMPAEMPPAHKLPSALTPTEVIAPTHMANDSTDAIILFALIFFSFKIYLPRLTFLFFLADSESIIDCISAFM